MPDFRKNELYLPWNKEEVKCLFKKKIKCA